MQGQLDLLAWHAPLPRLCSEPERGRDRAEPEPTMAAAAAAVQHPAAPCSTLLGQLEACGRGRPMLAGEAAALFAQEVGISLTAGAALAGWGELGQRIVRQLDELEVLRQDQGDSRRPAPIDQKKIVYRTHGHSASRTPDPRVPCMVCRVQRVPFYGGDVVCKRCEPLRAELARHPWDCLPFDWAAWLGDEGLVERWEERAAVMQVDGGLNELEAERAAFFALWCALAQPDPDLDAQVAALEVPCSFA